MNYLLFKNESGNECFVNLDKVTELKKINEDVCFKDAQGVTYKAPLGEFKKVVEANWKKDFTNIVNRLITAISRLTVQIPSSIRLHM